jgi:hypothetical protein
LSDEYDVDTMNKKLCEEIYSYFASHHGTRSPHATPADRQKGHPQHSRELKRLRKKKVGSMKALRQAQRERKPAETVRVLRGAYLRDNRAYSKALKKSRRAGNERTASKMKECATSFWKFASKILNGEASADADPTFSVDTAEQFFTNTYSSSPHTFIQPAWLPTPVARAKKNHSTATQSGKMRSSRLSNVARPPPVPAL